MPWMIRKNDKGEHCVYRKGANSEPEGDTLGCHASEAEAQEQIAALHANVSEMYVSEFKGDFPEVPLGAGIDLEALKADDPDPFFVTLPFARTGAVSGSGLEYDAELVNAVVQQINENHPTGIMGHIPEEKAGSDYPVPEVYWVGATQKDGTAWAKGYVPPGKARDTLRRLKAVGGKAATSIWGQPTRRVPTSQGRWKAAGFKLHQLDLAPYERAALKLGGGFRVTAEMQSQEVEDTMTREEILASLTAKEIPQALREQIVRETQAAAGEAGRVAELEQQATQAQGRIAELEGAVAKYQLAEFNAGLDGLVAEFVKIDAKDETGKARVDALRKSFRARMIAEIGAERDPAKIKALAQGLWDAEFKPLAEMLVAALAGPAAIVAGRVRNTRKIDDTPEARAQARAQTGI